MEKEIAWPDPTTVDEYMAELPDDRRAVVEELRRTINAAAPEATETIAYQMPALRSRDGQFLVSYASYKAHYSLFPANDEIVKALGAEIQPYLAGRARSVFRRAAIPMELVTKVVKIRLAEVARATRADLSEGGACRSRSKLSRSRVRRRTMGNVSCLRWRTRMRRRLVLAAVDRSRSRIAATATTPTAAATISRERIVVRSMHVPPVAGAGPPSQLANVPEA